MFVITQSPTYKWPVKFQIPGDNAPIEISFTGIFKRKTQSEVEQLFTASTVDGDVVKEVLVGWEGVVDEQGKPVEFNPVTLAQVLDIAGARAAVVTVFTETFSGKALRKNS